METHKIRKSRDGSYHYESLESGSALSAFYKRCFIVGTIAIVVIVAVVSFKPWHHSPNNLNQRHKEQYTIENRTVASDSDVTIVIPIRDEDELSPDALEEPYFATSRSAEREPLDDGRDAAAGPVMIDERPISSELLEPDHIDRLITAPPADSLSETDSRLVSDAVYMRKLESEPDKPAIYTFTAADPELVKEPEEEHEPEPESAIYDKDPSLVRDRNNVLPIFDNDDEGSVDEFQKTSKQLRFDEDSLSDEYLEKLERGIVEKTESSLEKIFSKKPAATEENNEDNSNRLIDIIRARISAERENLGMEPIANPNPGSVPETVNLVKAMKSDSVTGFSRISKEEVPHDALEAVTKFEEERGGRNEENEEEFKEEEEKENDGLNLDSFTEKLKKAEEELEVKLQKFENFKKPVDTEAAKAELRRSVQFHLNRLLEELAQHDTSPKGI